jgi:hypothetical protein
MQFEIPTALEKLTIMSIWTFKYKIFMDIAINEFLICLAFVLVMSVSVFKVHHYFANEIINDATVEAHSIHVVLPGINDLTKDKTKLNAMNVTHQENAKKTYNQLTLKTIHKHFSENFGEIHRMYIGRDFNQLQADST